MLKRSDALFAVLLPVLDASAATAGFSAAYFIRLRTDLIPFVQSVAEHLPPYRTILLPFIVFGVALAVFLAIAGQYRIGHRRPIRTLPTLLWTALLWWFSIVAYYAIIEHTLFYSRLILIYGAVLTGVLLVAFRGLVALLRRLLYRRGVGVRSILLVGENTIAARLLRGLRKRSGARVVGVLADVRDPAWEQDHPGVPYRGTVDTLHEHLHDVDEVIVCEQTMSREALEELLELSLDRHRRFRFVPHLFELHATNVVTEEVAGIPVIEHKPTKLDGWGKIVKRLFDLVAATLGLILLSPLFLLIAVLVRATSKGPAVVGLTRVRKDRTFTLYKFRSMVVNAHAMKAQLEAHNERKDGPLFKMKHDPRITPLGRFLRKSRLDELPQLWNVFLGDMSVVGPRPHEPGEVARYSKHHRKLLRITPGITGLAQVRGASDLPFEEEVRLDTYYIENWSPLLDVEILFRTLLVVLTGRGAA